MQDAVPAQSSTKEGKLSSKTYQEFHNYNFYTSVFLSIFFGRLEANQLNKE